MGSISKFLIAAVLLSANSVHAKLGNRQIYFGRVQVTSPLPEAHTKAEALAQLKNADLKTAGYGRPSMFARLLGYKVSEGAEKQVARDFVAMSSMRTEAAQNALLYVYFTVFNAKGEIKYDGILNASALVFGSDGYTLKVEASDFLRDVVQVNTGTAERASLTSRLVLHSGDTQESIDLDKRETAELLKLPVYQTLLSRLASSCARILSGK